MSEQTASLSRDLRTSAYFSKHLSLKAAAAFAEVPPLEVIFKKMSLYIHPLLGILRDTHIFAALNCTLVALCSDEGVGHSMVSFYICLFCLEVF